MSKMMKEQFFKFFKKKKEEELQRNSFGDIRRENFCSEKNKGGKYTQRE